MTHSITEKTVARTLVTSELAEVGNFVIAKNVIIDRRYGVAIGIIKKITKDFFVIDKLIEPDPLEPTRHLNIRISKARVQVFTTQEAAQKIIDFDRAAYKELQDTRSAIISRQQLEWDEFLAQFK